MTDLIYKYTAPTKDHDEHIWSLRGPKGGVHVWARERHQRSSFSNEKFIGGVEVHSPKPIYEWGDQNHPNHENCFLLGGPCWHDGTSLYFSERVGPMLRDGPPFDEADHQFVYSVLFDFYQHNLRGAVEDNANG